MIRSICILSLAVNLPLGLQPVASPIHAQEHVDWTADITFLRERLKLRAPALAARDEFSSFEGALDSVEKQLPGLTDNEVVLAIAKAMVLLGDGHTLVPIAWQGPEAFLAVYPLKLWPIQSSWVVIDADQEYRDLIGTRITGIEDTPIDQVFERIQPYIARDNEYQLLADFDDLAMSGQVLFLTGIADDASQVAVHAELADGDLVTRTLHTVENEDAANWVGKDDSRNRALWLANRDKRIWGQMVEGTDIFFAQFNSADVSPGDDHQVFLAALETVHRDMMASDARRLVIDLRHNDGGNIPRTRNVLNLATSFAGVRRRNPVFVLISSQTFSAGVIHALRFEQYVDPIFVGTPLSGMPNRIGELRRFALPNSGLRIRYSAVMHSGSTPEDYRPSIFPDIPAPLTQADYNAIRDPALEAIHRFSHFRPLEDALRPIIMQAGVEAAVEKFHVLKSQTSTLYDVSEDAIHDLATSYASGGKLEVAHALFELNLTEHPWSPHAMADLAFIKAQLGQEREAVALYTEAFNKLPLIDDGVDTLLFQ